MKVMGYLPIYVVPLVCGPYHVKNGPLCWRQEDSTESISTGAF